MAHERSPEEAQAEIINAMGRELGSIFYALYKEVVWVHAKWKEYRELYGTNGDRIKLLNRTAGFFFKIVQDSLWEDVLMHIARITDPPKSFGKHNLTVQLLPELISEKELLSEVNELAKNCVDKSAFAREHRNKRLAHRDLIHATEPSAAPLNGISRAHVEEMLEALRSIMNKIDGHYRDTEVAYDHFIAHSGGEALYFSLKRAEEAKNEGRLL